MNKITKSELNNPCKSCNAICCSYILFDSPKFEDNKRQIDIDSIYWYLTRSNIMINITPLKTGKFSLSHTKWEVIFESNCKYLKDNRCTIYKNRPIICSDHQAFPSICLNENYFSTKEFCEKYDISGNAIQIRNSKDLEIFLYKYFKIKKWYIKRNKYKLNIGKLNT